MKLLISVLAILTFSPSTFGLGNTYMTTDTSDLCKNESLTLDAYYLVTLSRGFIASSFLRCVKIKASRIEITKGSFENMSNLMYLDFTYTDVYLPDLFSFGELPSVRILRLAREYYVGYVGDAILDYVYPHLEYLDLRNNGISRISNSRENPFPNLTSIDLSGNRIHQDTLNLMPDTLLHLNLSINELSSLRLNGTRNLLLLRLDHNNIEVIGDGGVTFSGLEKLVSLSMAYNRISQINERQFEDMRNLRYLNLTGNRLSSTSLNVTAYLPSLETLILDRNLFENVPLSTSSNITTLSLNCNRITHLTASSFFNLPYLKRLHLSGNMMESVDVNMFQNQTLLEELHLDGNLLSYFPANWCQYTQNLRYLNLARNKFTSLKSVIYSPTLPILELHLEGNPVAYNNSSAAQQISKNMTIYLNGDVQSIETLCKSKPNVVSLRPPNPFDYYGW